jgi:predicted cupin superfamily sugar epimerase
MEGMTAKEVKAVLDLQPHPEGGFFTETFRDPTGVSTAIYYLLEAQSRSHWHRVHRSTEIWHHYAGGPLTLKLSGDGHSVEQHLLGKNLVSDERPQIIVPAGSWQSAESGSRWTLVGCTVAPGFEFENFEMAPPDWQPG